MPDAIFLVTANHGHCIVVVFGFERSEVLGAKDILILSMSRYNPIFFARGQVMYDFIVISS